MIGELVTVAIPAHRHDEHLLELLRELDRQAAPHRRLEVVVSDDAALQPLEEAIDVRDFPALAIRFVRGETSGGPGAARNRALGVVDSEWIVFLDSDERPAPRWVDRMLELLGDGEETDVYEGSVVPDRAEVTPFTHTAEKVQAEGQHVAGNLALRTEVLRSAGGFDERFFDSSRKLHFREDIELYFRLRDRGCAIRYVPDWVVHHPALSSRLLNPVREARRYYFDPLLAREHPEAFSASIRARRLGPLPLRWARHEAALLLAAGVALLPLSVWSRSSGLRGLAVGATVAGWAASTAALAWGRTVPRRSIPSLFLVSLATPWVYLWNYYRGVIDFRHRPRLR